MVMSIFVTTRPTASNMDCGLRLGLIQSDEPEWEKGTKNHQPWRDMFMLRGFNDIIISDYMYEFADKYNMNIAGKIPLGIDTNVFYPNMKFETPKPNDHSMMVVTKGIHVWYDGFDYLVPAIEKLSEEYSDLRVLWLGFSPPSLPCTLEHYRTYDEKEVAQIYNKASVYVLPSLIEGSPTTVKEAMACGTAVITTAIGVDWGVDKENVVFIPPKDSNSIVDAVSMLFDDERMRERIALNGLRTIRARKPEKCIEEFGKILEGLL